MSSAKAFQSSLIFGSAFCMREPQAVKESAAEVGARVVRGAALIEDHDFGAAVMRLTGGHQTRAAGARTTTSASMSHWAGISCLTPRRMSKRCGGRRCRSSCAEEGAAGKILCVHDGYHLKFRLKEWQSLHSRRDLP